MVLALVVSFNWDIRQLDVSNAFLHGILDEEVYMAQPKGFEDPTNPQFVYRVNLIGIRPYHAPCVLGTKLSKFDGDPLLDPSEYRHTVGALQYITLTRPEIAYYMNQLCQHMQTPTTAHWTTAKRVLRYLKNTLDFGLFYKPGSFAINAYYVQCVAMVCLLVPILSLGQERNNWSLNQAIEVKYRCRSSYRILVMLLCELKFLLILLFGVITLVLLYLLVILFFIPALSISKWTIILCVRK
ncbi:hypothetical protein AAG906_028993 [Vitis piasezkii]